MVKKKKKGAKKKGKSKDLTIHFMPYSEIAHEDTIGRIKKIMGIVLDNKIIILQGKLRADEETRLIENSMTLIGNIDGFAGIEIATMSNSDNHDGFFDRIRHKMARILVGEQDAITIIGPATVVKEMKQDPQKLELMLQQK
jgi:hypothetical protein